MQTTGSEGSKERYWQSLLRLSKGLEMAKSYAEVLDTARKEVREIVGYQNIWVFLFDDQKEQARALSASGSLSDMVMFDENVQTLHIKGDPMLEEIASSVDIVVVEDARTDERTDKKIVELLQNRTIVNVPIIFLDRHLGSVGTGTFGDEGVRLPTASDREFLMALASHLAVTLDRLRLMYESKRSEKALRESEEKYRRIVDMASEGIWSMDVDGACTFLNARMSEILGYEKEQIVGRPLGDFMFAEDLPDHHLRLTQRSQGLSDRYERRLRHANGEEVWTIFSATPIADEKGQYSGSFAMVTDITARKRSEEQLLALKNHLEEQVMQRTADLVAARNAAEAASRAKSVFLASMSHELRTPLNAILGFSRLLQSDRTLPDHTRKNVEIINRSGTHLLRLINDVLDMAKIESGSMQLQKAPFDLGELLCDVTDLMRQRAEEKGLQLIIDQDSTFPRYIVADEGRVRQILINLIGNAVKFTEQGGVTLRLGTRENTLSHLQIEVEDSGKGIAPEECRRIFEPFVQLGDQGGSHGTGLGLAITKQYVELMGGSISVTSSPEKGSVFRVELPLEEAKEDDIQRANEAEQREILGIAGRSDYRILIVEDQRDNQLLLQTLMENIGLSVRIASNGEEGVRLFESYRPHFIWMDRRMPVMDGIEATKKIRSLPGGADVRIVAVTASAFAEQRDEMLAVGLDDFVRKPYRPAEIYDCLAEHLKIEYLYESVPSAHRMLTAESFSSIPQEILSELRSSLESLHVDRIERAVAAVGQYDRNLQTHLEDLTAMFEYEAILTALKGNE
ncbi:ATP-binding protein [Leptonema illini]|uniref:histidine kinase n=1 Tax=Leptonema illini DSM 21528 TaxID=929563 RepID=H2CA78_9LEPT|nr:ATP-binding protein [Leptonema illini]EHQ06236.1 multi-sensor hybrid histidine kinase [Leptonema illini DSM 21528]